MVANPLMRVGIDFHVFDGKFQGSRSHLLELFSRVISISPDIEFYLFLDDVEGLRAYSEAFCMKHVRLIRMPYRPSLIRLAIQFPRLAREYGLDLLHMQYISPFACPCPCMVTIHDVLFESHPEYFTPFFRTRSRLLIKHSAKTAAHVFTVSEFSKTELARRYQLPVHRVSVIPNGVDRLKFFPGEGGSLLTNRGLTPKGYILSVGRLEPRKNHITLLKAFATLGELAPPLVIVGQCDFRYQEALDYIQQSGLKGKVQILSDVDDVELPVLYRNAALFVYPSLAEGFGMPPLEALASGVPVITSNTTAIPEVMGNAGILIPPTDQDCLSRAMLSVLHDRKLAEDIVVKGNCRLVEFTWETSAAIVRSEYLKFVRLPR